MNKKKMLLSFGMFIAALMPSVTMADDDIVQLNHPVNVSMDSDDIKDEQEQYIFLPGTYYVYAKNGDYINITRKKNTPGGWVNRYDLVLDKMPRKFRVKEDTRVFVYEENSYFAPSYETLFKGEEITLYTNADFEGGYLLINEEEQKYVRQSDVEEITEYEKYFLAEDTEIKNQLGDIIGYEEKGFEAMGTISNNKFLFSYMGEVASLDLDKVTDKEPGPDYTDLVNLAIAQVGKSYISGDAGPNSFDCSGLTKYLYATVYGINLPRACASQSNVGRAVSFDELQPGDLLFFKNGISHVGIYVGDGKYVHASTPKRGVVMDSVYNGWVRAELRKIRRILN